MQYLVKFTKEYKPAIPGQIWRNTCNAGIRNAGMQYLVKYTNEYKLAIHGQIY